MTNTAEKIYTLPKELWLKLWNADCKPCRDNYFPLIEEVKNEVQQLDDYVHRSINNPEMRLKYIIDYVNNPKSLKHRIKDFLPRFMSEELGSITGGEIAQELFRSEGLFQYWQSKKELLYCVTYSEFKDYHFYTHGLLITLIGELYDRIKLYECETLSQQDTGGTETKKKQEQKKNVNQSLSVKMNFTGDKEELEKILTELKGDINFDDIKSALAGEIEIGKSANKNIDALAIISILKSFDKIKLNGYCFQHIADIFNLNKSSVKSQNTKCGYPITSKEEENIFEFKILPGDSKFEDKELFIERAKYFEKKLSFLKKN